MHAAWQHLWDYSIRHGVNPVVFAVLYLAHHPLFWGTMAWLAARARAKRPVAGLALLGAFFWVMPYAYVLAFGRGLPRWACGAALLLLAAGGAQAFRAARNRLGNSSQNRAHML